MLILCERCVRGVKSRGEKVLVREIVNDNEFQCCDWCDTHDFILFNAYFPEYNYGSIFHDTN